MGQKDPHQKGLHEQCRPKNYPSLFFFFLKNKDLKFIYDFYSDMPMRISAAK